MAGKISHELDYLSAQEQIEHEIDYAEWLATVEEVSDEDFDEFDEYFDF
jgi:hypothetical protein